MAKNEREDYILGLSNQLAKVLAAQDFANSDGGKLFIQLLDADVKKFREQVEGDKFINDHQGYVDARAKLSYANSLLSRFAKTSDTGKEVALRKEIDEAKGKKPAGETDDDE